MEHALVTGVAGFIAPQEPDATHPDAVAPASAGCLPEATSRPRAATGFSWCPPPCSRGLTTQPRGEEDLLHTHDVVS